MMIIYYSSIAFIIGMTLLAMYFDKKRNSSALSSGKKK